MAPNKLLAVGTFHFLTATILLQASHVSGTNQTSHCPGLDACLANLRNGQPCGVLPIPPEARLPTIPPGSFILNKLRTGVWAYEDGVYNSLMVFRSNHLVLVDFPDSDNSNTANGTGTLLTSAILDIVGNSKPRMIDMIYSHDHFDHIGAARRVFDFLNKEYPDASIRVWGTPISKQTIEDSSSMRAVAPTIFVNESSRHINMGGGLLVKVFAVGGHSGRDLAVHIPPSNGEQGVLMIVDVIYPKWAPFSSFSNTENVREYLRAHEKVLELDFGAIVGGHVRIGTKADVRTSLEFTLDVIEGARHGLQTSSSEDFARAGFGQFLNPEAVEFGNIWYAFVDIVRKVQTESCAQMVLKKWGCRLGGLGIVINTHCFSALQFVLLED